jgi:hypothetical protein
MEAKKKKSKAQLVQDLDRAVVATQEIIDHLGELPPVSTRCGEWLHDCMSVSAGVPLNQPAFWLGDMNKPRLGGVGRKMFILSDGTLVICEKVNRGQKRFISAASPNGLQWIQKLQRHEIEAILERIRGYVNARHGYIASIVNRFEHHPLFEKP